MIEILSDRSLNVCENIIDDMKSEMWLYASKKDNYSLMKLEEKFKLFKKYVKNSVGGSNESKSLLDIR